MTNHREKNMARIGTSRPEGEGLESDSVPAPLDLETAKRTTKEEEVDYMADAPPERPYGDAISDTHREFLATAGIDVPKATDSK